MLSPRRLTFQLTPLLDLLLIVIFAQYMDVQQKAETVQAESSEAVTNLQADLADLRDRHQQAVTRLDEDQQLLVDLRSENERLQEMLREYDEEGNQTVRIALEQRDLIARMMAEYFHIPQEAIDEILTLAGRAERSPAELQRLREILNELSRSRGEDIREYAVMLDEIRKRVDFWRIHLGDNGVVQVTAGEQSVQFRFRTAEQFEEELYRFYRDAPTPKDVVIMLLSYGDQTTFGTSKRALEGLSRATDRMRRDVGARTRFEYAIVGQVNDP